MRTKKANMYNKFFVLQQRFVEFFGFILLMFFGGCFGSTNPQNQLDSTWNAFEYVEEIYKQRLWCPQKKRYGYYKQIDHKEEISIKRYYKIRYYKKSGNVAVESAHLNWKRPAGRWLYYDVQGRLVREDEYLKGLLREQTFNMYDSRGNLVLKKNFSIVSGKNIMTGKTRYQYVQGKKIPFLANHIDSMPLQGVDGVLKRVVETTLGIRGDTLEYYYDKHGALTEKRVFFLNKKLKRSEKHYVDVLHRVKKKIGLDRDNKILWEREYEYDEQGNLKNQSFRQFAKDSSKKISLLGYYVYRRDNAGNVKRVEFREQRKQYQPLSLVYWIEWNYNQDGCWLWEKRFDSDGKLVEHILY